MEIPEKISKHIQPSGLNSKFDYGNLRFPAYIAAVNSTLKSINQKFQLDQSDQTIEYNSPFEMRPEYPTKTGALLVHGLFDTPFIMRDVGKHLCQQGMFVRCILLPGHGSIPADLLTTTTKEWTKAVAYGVESFRNQVDRIFLVGFSTGAALELNYVLQNLGNKPNIAGLIMLCPAMALNAKKSFFLGLYRVFRWLFKEQKWIFRGENPDYTKYTSYPVNSGYLVQRVIVENKLLFKPEKLNVPIFIAMSSDDETVRADVALEFFSKTKSDKNRFVLYSNDMQTYSDERIQVLPSAVPEQNILDMSHIAVPSSPSNHHYGRNADYQESLMEPHKQPMDNSIYYGAATPENERTYRMRRLTYNPFFDQLMQSIDQFVESTTT